MKQKVVTFGEIMLRLAPEGYYRFVQADTFGATYGGGEANVAVSLANYGFDAKYVTRLPNHEIGQCAVNSLRKYGVDTSYIARGGDRIGIYYLEKVLANVLVKLFMIVLDLVSIQLQVLILTGMKSLKTVHGFILQGLHQHYVTM